MDNVLKMTVEAGDGCKAYHFRDGENGLLRTAQKIAGLHDPCAVQIIQRAHVHDGMKNPAEVRGAQTADLSQLFHGELRGIVVFNVIQGRRDDQRVFGYGNLGWGGINAAEAFSSS